MLKYLMSGLIEFTNSCKYLKYITFSYFWKVHEKQLAAFLVSFQNENN